MTAIRISRWKGEKLMRYRGTLWLLRKGNRHFNIPLAVPGPINGGEQMEKGGADGQYPELRGGVVQCDLF